MDQKNVRTKLLSLKDLLSVKNENEIMDILSSFHCSKNFDVESFLRTKSIRFEKADKSRTYLIIECENIDTLKNIYFENGYKFFQVDMNSNLVQLYKPIKTLTKLTCVAGDMCLKL